MNEWEKEYWWKEKFIDFRVWIVCILISIFMYWVSNTVEWIWNFLVWVIMFIWGIICFVIWWSLIWIILWWLLWLILWSILKILWILNPFLKFWNWFKYSFNEFLNKYSDEILSFVCKYILPIIFIAWMIIFAPYGDNRTCYNKTSIDYNRQNDMKCVNENWDVKRTDYEWARKLMWK
jgi:hypothetical protein